MQENFICNVKYQLPSLGALTPHISTNRPVSFSRLKRGRMTLILWVTLKDMVTAWTKKKLSIF
jgi:hypothetical protein